MPDRDVDGGAETPGPDENLVEPVLRWAGVKTYGSFISGTQCVDVTEEWGQFSVTPMKNAESRSGFEYLDEFRQTLDAPSNEDLGRPCVLRSSRPGSWYGIMNTLHARVAVLALFMVLVPPGGGLGTIGPTVHVKASEIPG